MGCINSKGQNDKNSSSAVHPLIPDKSPLSEFPKESPPKIGKRPSEQNDQVKELTKIEENMPKQQPLIARQNPNELQLIDQRSQQRPFEESNLILNTIQDTQPNHSKDHKNDASAFHQLQQTQREVATANNQNFESNLMYYDENLFMENNRQGQQKQVNKKVIGERDEEQINKELEKILNDAQNSKSQTDSVVHNTVNDIKFQIKKVPEVENMKEQERIDFGLTSPKSPYSKQINEEYDQAPMKSRVKLQPIKQVSDIQIKLNDDFKQTTSQWSTPSNFNVIKQQDALNGLTTIQFKPMFHQNSEQQIQSEIQQNGNAKQEIRPSASIKTVQYHQQSLKDPASGDSIGGGFNMATSTKPSVFNNNEKEQQLEDNNLDLDELKAFLDQGNQGGSKNAFGSSVSYQQRNMYGGGLNDNQFYQDETFDI